MVFGCHGDPGQNSKPDISLFAADVLPRHCCFQRPGAGRPTTLCPYRDATVTRNSEVLTVPVQLNPGDVIGLGEHYLFLFKDPLSLPLKVHVKSYYVYITLRYINTDLCLSLRTGTVLLQIPGSQAPLFLGLSLIPLLPRTKAALARRCCAPPASPPARTSTDRAPNPRKALRSPF